MVSSPYPHKAHIYVLMCNKTFVIFMENLILNFVVSDNKVRANWDKGSYNTVIILSIGTEMPGQTV